LRTIIIASLAVVALAGQAGAQYYPPQPVQPPYPGARGPVYDDDDDQPGLYGPPPGPYGHAGAPYGDEGRPGSIERQALPAPGAYGAAPEPYPTRDPYAASREPYPGTPYREASPGYPDRATPAYPERGPRTYSAIPNDGWEPIRPPGEIQGVPSQPGYAAPVQPGYAPPVQPGYAPPAQPGYAAPGATPDVSGRGQYAALPPDYRPEEGQPKELPLHLRRQLVDYPTAEPAGTLVIDTPNTYLYLVLGNGKAMRYGIGVGRDGFTWSGRERVTKMAEWPDWHPPKEMIERQPYLPRFMAGGESNPLGARALYLGNTVYRIHGTNQPSTIGTFVSSGCIRLTNEDIQDLYGRVTVGTRVVVLPGRAPGNAALQSERVVTR
jgi:lipoprotein-anchoring transpeptidase ErfK/SrfK